ncbi:alpha/beta hydrolase [Puniceicoccus vermicola]|uniref:Prolyl oligopeptidase family serine peptidase n=1 Tax=Puniceicoccus vermicola TaxID=388746 RepID=A0A7X1B1C0_9BACT|nr:prolyl oligopeptidase family serine peptidase [Puniceicoccus vermicola]MBC2603654.1 prolyl oligopeptidase family serine peptidase [Puniceicoccus vermicola]
MKFVFPFTPSQIGILFLLSLMNPSLVHGTESHLEKNGWTAETFKSVDVIDLKIWHKAPVEAESDPKTAGIVFFYGGGSAGGHLAAACALLPTLNDPSDPPVSCKPNALILFNPVYDNGPGGYGHDRMKDRWEEISPLHHIDEEAPPNIVFLGTEDQVMPVETACYWKAKMEACGVRSELYLYANRKHGFFNGGEDYTDTVQKMHAFLASLGYLPFLGAPL